MRQSDFALQLQDYRLTTAEIVYHLPDHPRLLQSFIWQEFDLAPKFPTLHKFIAFWNRELDGKIHSIRVAHTDAIITSNHFSHTYDLGQLH